MNKTEIFSGAFVALWNRIFVAKSLSTEFKANSGVSLIGWRILTVVGVVEEYTDISCKIRLSLSSQFR